MKRRQVRQNAAAGLVFLVLNVAGATLANAQTWHWKYVTHTPNIAPLAADSTVAVEAGELRMSYTVPLERRQVVIESCHAALADVANASTLHSQGRTFLLVALKASRPAACASGRRPAVALPSDDERFITSVAAAINRSCCVRAVVAKVTHATSPPKPAPTLAATHIPAPARTPTPAPMLTTTLVPAPTRTKTRVPTAASAPNSKSSPRTALKRIAATADWVETAGLFAFVRIKNLGSNAVRVRDVDVLSCRGVALGCGRQRAQFVVDPHAVITLAAVTSADQIHAPIFLYRYVAAHGNDTSARSGASASTAPSGAARMSAREIHIAEAGTLDQTQPAQSAAAASFAPPRLLNRGTSRLAIGETGTALVRLVIGPDGTPQAATIVSITNRRLAAAAIETAVSSRFVPATQNRTPVVAKYVATFSFDGEDPALSTIPLWKRSPGPASSGLEPATAPVTPSPDASTSPAALESPLKPTGPALPPQPSVTPAATPQPSPPVAPAPTPPLVPPVTPAPTPQPQAPPAPTPQAEASPITPSRGNRAGAVTTSTRSAQQQASRPPAR